VYRALCAPLNPIILDLDDFEANICNQVVGLANGQLLHSIVTSSGRSQEAALTHLGLLLATIASGIQYSDVTFEERNQLLQEYSQHSSLIPSFSVVNADRKNSQKLFPLSASSQFHATTVLHFFANTPPPSNHFTKRVGTPGSVGYSQHHKSASAVSGARH
jgi:hypothetical protein